MSWFGRRWHDRPHHDPLATPGVRGRRSRVNPGRPKWGEGVVTVAHHVGGLPLMDGTVWMFDPKRTGQRLSVKFADGRTRTLLSATTVLHKVSGNVGYPAT